MELSDLPAISTVHLFLVQHFEVLFPPFANREQLPDLNARNRLLARTVMGTCWYQDVADSDGDCACDIAY